MLDASCADTPGVVVNVTTANGQLAHDQEAWAGRNWTCADFAGYGCAVGGWGLQSSYTTQEEGRRLRDLCPASCIDGRCPRLEVAPLPAPKTVFVFGLESSGTRFVSQALARALNPGTLWDGQSPPCWWWRGHRIVHVSLPMLGMCNPDDYDQPEAALLADANMCQPLPSEAPLRWIANISSTLERAGEAARAVVVNRHHIFQRVSKMHKHGCGSSSPDGRVVTQASNAPVFYRSQLAWRREDAIARATISEALRHAEIGPRVLHVPYEELGWLAELHWGRIA